MVLGESTAAISQATGYSMGHLRTLAKDPAFCELLEGWKKQAKKGYDGTMLKIQSAATGAVDEFNRRLEFEPKEISTKDLLQGATIFLDRSGYGATSTVVLDDVRAATIKNLDAIEAEVIVDHKSDSGDPVLCAPAGGETEAAEGGEEEGASLRETGGAAASPTDDGTLAASAE